MPSINAVLTVTAIIATAVLLSREYITVKDMEKLYRETQRRGTVDDARQMFRYIRDTRR
jgi:hypothetical protein